MSSQGPGLPPEVATRPRRAPPKGAAASLVEADDARIAEIYRESHSLWGAGLSLEGYLEFWAELRDTPWARRHYRHLAWVDESGVLLSSFKRYRPALRMDGVVTSAMGIGAVFTPADRRGEGNARRMIEAALASAQGQDGAAVLFTDIGVEYYAEMGFRPLPATESWGTIPRPSPSPPGVIEEAIHLRPMTRDDLPVVAACHAACTAVRRLAFLRDVEQWDYLLVRAEGYYRRFDGTDLSGRYRVAVRAGQVVGYLVAVDSPGQWVLREVGAANGDLDLAEAILRIGGAQARREGCRNVYGWLPRRLAERLPDWRLRTAPRRQAIPMILPLSSSFDVASARVDDDIPFLDQF